VVVVVVVVVVVSNGFSHYKSSLALCAKQPSPHSFYITFYPNPKEDTRNLFPNPKEQ
jgi:hypothetical protein